MVREVVAKPCPPEAKGANFPWKAPRSNVGCSRRHPLQPKPAGTTDRVVALTMGKLPMDEHDGATAKPYMLTLFLSSS